MTVEEKIQNQLRNCDRWFRNSLHEECIRELWEIVPPALGEVEDIEIIGVSRTYKVVFKDGRKWKTYIFRGNEFEKLVRIVHEAGIRVAKPVGDIPRKAPGSMRWRFVEWIEGHCDRDSMRNRIKLQEIPPDDWYKLGELIGQVHSIKSSEALPTRFIGVCDILWANYIKKDNGEVWISDTKKFFPDVIPDRWIYQFVMFNEHILLEQKIAFTKGYVSTLKGVRSKEGLASIEAAMIFSKEVYEKLAREQRISTCKTCSKK